MESTDKKPKISQEAGFTLVEAVIASAILMLVVSFSYRAADGFLKATAVKASKRVGEQTVALLSKAVKRDWELRAKDKPATNASVTSCASGTNQCKNMDIIRVKPDTTGDTTISFRTLCKSVTGDPITQSQLNQLDFSKILAKTSCLKHLACAAGTVPWVEIQSSDPAALPSYPPILLQGSAKILPRGPIGIAMCSGKEDSTLTITLESFYIKNAATVAGAKQLEVEFSKQELVLVSEKESDGLQLFSTGVQIK